MHIIVMLFCVPILVGLFLALTVWLPFQLFMEGLANHMPILAVAGLLLFLFVWGGIFSAFSH